MNKNNDKLRPVPPYQTKPTKTKTYREKVRDGTIRPKTRSKKLKNASPKRQAANARYRALAEEWIIGQTCAICGQHDHLSVHHKKGRGKYLLDTSTWVALCLTNNSYVKMFYPTSNHSFSGGCHGWVEANHKIARTLNLIQ